jgi:transcriptional regulator PpsR
MTAVKHFKAPEKTFGDLDAGTVAKLVLASSDLTLVLDRKGIIRDLSLDADDLEDEDIDNWIGQSWFDIVTVESRPKIERMLDESREGSASRWRQVNHPVKQGNDIPIRYSAVRVSEDGRIVALGRDLRPMAVLQQRLVTAQSEIEREYSRLRQIETRYHTLFQLTSEPVIVLDSATMRIVEVNPAATQLLAHGSSRIAGKPFLDLLDDASKQAAQTLFADLRASARSDEIRVRFSETGQEFSLGASLFRHDASLHYLLRLSRTDAETGRTTGGANQSSLQRVIASLPEGFVVVGEDQRILMANTAFLDLAQLVTESQARGENISRWLGRSDVDTNIVFSNLRQHGSMRRFASVMRGEFGGQEDIELSGVAVMNGEPSCFGLVMRKAPSALTLSSGNIRVTPGSVDQLKELIGRMSLRDLVRETTDIIEQMCISAALELTGDNRASAAEMLGLSRQSFYVKLRRHGLGELDPSEGR